MSARLRLSERRSAIELAMANSASGAWAEVGSATLPNLRTASQKGRPALRVCPQCGDQLAVRLHRHGRCPENVKLKFESIVLPTRSPRT